MRRGPAKLLSAMTNQNLASLHASLDALDLATLGQRGGNKWTLYESDVVPAWVADMDFPPAQIVRDWIARVAQAGDLGYAPKAAFDPMPGAFSRWCQRRHNWAPAPESMKVMVDIVQCLYIGVQAFSKPGEGVIVQTPIYPPMHMAVTETERRLVVNPLVASGDRFEVDFRSPGVSRRRLNPYPGVVQPPQSVWPSLRSRRTGGLCQFCPTS